MAESSYPFPPDRFDEEADAVSFHGAHRAEEPFWRQNLVYLVIIAVALVTLLALLFAFGGGGSDERANDPSPTAEQSEEAAEPSDAGGEEEPLPEADKDTGITVMNAGGINGLAGTWRDTLSEAGWSDVQVGTASSVQEESVVFYREEADRGTAQALADEVGAGEAQQSDEYERPVTFVAVTMPGEGDGGEG